MEDRGSVPLLDPCAPAGVDDEHASQAGRRFANVVVLTIGFSLLFLAYNTLQAYVSSLLPGNLGFQSLVVVYVAYEVSLVAAPFICEVIGDRGAMVLGSAMYVVYIASLAVLNPAAILVASVLIGFGAAILWVAQGSALTLWSTDATRGRNAGVFWGGFQLSAIAGPLMSYSILSNEAIAEGSKVTVLFTVFAAISVAGVATLALHWLPCLRISSPAPLRSSGSRDSASTTLNKAPVCVRMWAPVRRGIALCGTRDVALLLSACAFTGVEVSFSNGEFFKLVGLLPCDAFAKDETGCRNQTAGCLWNATAR